MESPLTVRYSPQTPYSSQPTYKGWKVKKQMGDVRAVDLVPSLPTRDGKASFHLRADWAAQAVPSLPTRDGKKSRLVKEGQYLVVPSLPTRDGKMEISVR